MKKTMKSTLKKVMAFLFAACLVAGMLSGCNSSQKEEEGQTDKTEQGEGKRTKVTVGVADNLEDLAPWGNVTRPSRYMVYGNLYQHLMEAETMGSDKMQGVLAKEWSQEDDKTYVITLYDYIKDSAGNEFKASDAVFSLESWAEVSDTYIDSCEVVDEYTFKVKLTTAAPGSFQRTMESAWMVTQASYEASGDGMATKPIGTNPYVLSEFVSGSKIVLEKSDHYWQTDDSLTMRNYKAPVDVIEYSIISEVTQMGIALEMDTIQIGTEMDTSLLDGLLADDTLTLTQGFAAYTRGLMFCMTPESPFYNNLALRQAVCYAIDEESLADIVGMGYGWATGNINNYESEVGYNKEWEDKPYYQYDPEKAKELLKEAGYEEGELSLRIMSNTNGTVKNMLETVQANLIAVGINAEIITADSSTYGAYRDGTSGQYDISYVGCDYGSNVLTVWNLLYDSSIRESGWTWGGLDDAKLQEMLDVLNTPDGFTQENIDEFYYYTSDNCLYYVPFILPEAYVHDNRISDVVMDSSGYLRINAATFADDYDVYAE